MTSIFRAAVRPWLACVMIDAPVICSFEPVGWLEVQMSPNAPPGPSRSASAEIFRAGGIAPRALVSATFEAGLSDELEIRVAYSASRSGMPPTECVGCLGHPLTRGLTLEFARATLDGFAGPDQLARPGVLTVSGGAYDVVDSSRYAFLRAAWLLKFVLFEMRDLESAQEQLEQFLAALPIAIGARSPAA